MGVPYALAVVAAVWRWGRGVEANMPRAFLRAGQLYAGAALLRFPATFEVGCASSARSIEC